MAETCIDPELSRELFRWAMHPENYGRAPSEKRLSDHLESCAECQALVADWARKARAGRLLVEANRVLEGNLGTGEKVESIKTSHRTVIFKYASQHPDSGLLIALDLNGRIESVVASASRADFEKACKS